MRLLLRLGLIRRSSAQSGGSLRGLSRAFCVLATRASRRHAADEPRRNERVRGGARLLSHPASLSGAGLADSYWLAGEHHAVVVDLKA